ncbi:ATPase [Vallitalea longa]|uniref:P-type Ca(2+) transporter n=1 Tax=Vallitalea longa TaxID=2936439 RepID=A0A9W5YBJ5_9FIRM|nr:calcium-translocating P-type ATPase, PMCA-type [Vallitalea longa]GKX29348.1 ATPase [Vallitalea longa]
MAKYHSMSIKDIAMDLKVDTNNGLSSEEVNERQAEYGPNSLKEKQGKTVFKMVIEQFASFIILILIAASILSIAIGEVVDGIVIIGIVVLNAVLGIVQERKASNALNALKEMAAPKAKVIRDGKISSIDSKELVPGDIIVLEAGDYVPADIRLIESINLKIDESALTGESVAVEKDADSIMDAESQIADRVNCAYMSTIVTYGRGRGIIVGTSMKTEIGKIASMLNEAVSEETPLQKKLDAFGKMLGIVCIGVCVIIFILGLLRKQPPIEVLMTSVSLAVAAIPEGLLAVVTVVLAMGMQRMIKRHAIMKRLGAVETLGSTTVICTDKTGTLTQNKMTVVKIFDGVDHWDVSGTGYTTDGDIISEGKDKKLLDKMLISGILCNDSRLKDEDIIGDPTEGALIVLGAKAGYDRDELNNKYPRIKEYPFDSDRKLMSTLHNIDGNHTMFTKGAPDVILSRCTNIIIDGKRESLTQNNIDDINEVNRTFAENALRVLGFAYKEVTDDADLEQEENELTFVGLAGMIDPPRQEAKDAVGLCKNAGIRVVMITGDHVVTGSAIAKEIGIIDNDNQAMEGKYINDYSEKELSEKVKTTSVFARVSPEHKVRIVESIRSNGDIAAMTGDGVNDAPALKKADIGIAMGITGTDVSKEAADMILTDDNFASIVDAVEEGRIIYSNIRKFVGFLLSCNIGEILIIFISMLLGWPVPLVPIQLLWINLITDSFPAFALGLEKGEEGIMNEKPRNPKEPIVDHRMKVALIFQSIGLTIAVLISYQLGFVMAGDVDDSTRLTIARTLCFITLIIGEMLRAYSARSETISIFRMNFLGNKYLNYSVLLAILLLVGVVYIPVLQPIFRTFPIDLAQIGVAVGLAVIPVITGELAKTVKK